MAPADPRAAALSTGFLVYPKKENGHAG
jgi:hypothetical protein